VILIKKYFKGSSALIKYNHISKSKIICIKAFKISEICHVQINRGTTTQEFRKKDKQWFTKHIYTEK
jgi:hypothetical protein